MGACVLHETLTVDFPLWAGTQWAICISKPASFSPPWSALWRLSQPPPPPPPSSEHYELHVLFKGASNVPYISDVSVRLSDMPQRAFLKAINSVHIGDTDVLKSSFCCARWPRSAASEGLRWDKWLLRASLLLHLSHFSYTLKMKSSH